MASGRGLDQSKTPMPISTFIMLEIGSMTLGSAGLSVGNDPTFIKSFMMSRVSQFSGNVQFSGPSPLNNGSMFDKAVFELSVHQDYNLERKIMEFLSKEGLNAAVRFRYGYVNGIKSVWYTGSISSFGLSSDMYNIKLTLAPKLPGDSQNKFFSETINQVTNKEYTRYSDIVTDIAKSQGWKIGLIVPTKKVSEIEYPDTNMTPQYYINEVVIPQCISEDDEGGYAAEFKPDDSGNPVFYFRPTTCKVNGSINIDQTFEFEFNVLPNGNVLAFNPKLTDGLAAIGENSYTGSKENSFSSVSKDTKEMVTSDYKTDTSGGSGVFNANGTVLAANETNVSMNASLEDSVIYTASTVKGHLGEFVYTTAMNPSAEIQIIGDPEIRSMDYVNVVAMYPAKSRNSGLVMHPSSGTYHIYSAIDNISNGQYTTTLNMYKVNNDTDVNNKDSKTNPAQTESGSNNTSTKDTLYRRGDTVYFTGSTQYVNANPSAMEDVNVKPVPGYAQIRAINYKLLHTPGAHPYNLASIGELTAVSNNINGWVNEGDFEYREEDS